MTTSSEELLSKIEGFENITRNLANRLRKVADKYVDKRNQEEFTSVQWWIDEQFSFVHERLITDTEWALESTPEYADLPAYASRLIQLVRNPEILNIFYDGVKVHVNVRAFEVLGRPEDFANAVRRVRPMVRRGSRPLNRVATFTSYFWREYLYKPAREGKQIRMYQKPRRTDRKTKGTMNEDRTTALIEDYFYTMSLRMNNLQKAPYWYIINYGSEDYGQYSQGYGDPYPSNQPTHFIENFERWAEGFLNHPLYQYQRNLIPKDSLLNEEERLLNAIDDIVHSYDFKYQRWTMEVNKIFDTFEFDMNKYKLYVTKTRKLGFMKVR